MGHVEFDSEYADKWISASTCLIFFRPELGGVKVRQEG